MRIGLGLIALLFLVSPTIANDQLLPNPQLTPGQYFFQVGVVNICTKGYAGKTRSVPQSEKDAVYKRYGITTRAPGQYEIDHLISLELGGTNDISNLWPESYVTKPLNAHVKDALENHLHALVCNGKLALSVAQKEIASNWELAYVKYLGPLPTK